MQFTGNIEDEDGNQIEIRVTLDAAFAYLLAELEEIGPRIASDNPQLAARINGEVIDACTRAGKRFAIKQILQQTELVN